MAVQSRPLARRLLSSLRVRLAVLICVTVIPPFAALLVNMNFHARRDATEEAYDDAERIADLVALDHQRMVEGARQLAGSLAGLAVVRERDGAACSALVQTLRPALPAYANFGAADLRGDVFCSAVPAVGAVNVAGRLSFRRALAERRFSAGEYTVGPVSRKPVISFASPILDDGGEPQGVAFVAVDLAWLHRRATEVKLHEGSRILVLDHQGTVLVRHPDPEDLVGRPVRDAEVVRAALAAGGPRRLRGKGPDGMERFYALRPVTTEGLAGSVFVLAGIPTVAALGPARAALWQSLPLLGVVALVGLVVAWLGGERLIVRPARALRDAARRLSEGQLDARTGLPHDAGELGRLAQSFDEMAEAIAERTAQLERQAALERALGEAESANASTSEFLSRMSHELRTPLNAILGFGQLLEMSVKDRGDRESVEEVLRAGRRLLELVDEVLAISRAEAGRLALSLEPVEVGEVISGTLDMARSLAAERAIHLRAAGSGVSGRHVRADNQQLRQVLLNLVMNGIKHNVEGGTVEVGCEAAADGWLRIAVKDDGPGIPPELQSRLFTPFDRLGAEARGIGGAGLGLALSRRLVEAMGGRIGVQSLPGQGSTFWVELPEAEGAVERQAALETRDGAVAADASPRGTVLYIEDNLSNLRLLERLLAQRPGIRLIPAMQGRVGLDLAREHRPDLILLDLHLPDLSGLEVLRALRQDRELERIPVVMLTADETPGQLERLREAGARAHFSKPLDVRRLLALVDDILNVEDSAR